MNGQNLDWLTYADNGEKTAGEWAFAAVAEEQAGVAGGAEVAVVDIFGEQTGGHELRTIGSAKIEVDVFRRWLVTGRLHVEPLQRIGFFAGAGLIEIVRGIGELRGELGNEVGGNLVAAGTDGRADGGEKIGGLAAKFELHAADSFLGDAGERAAPTGMDGGDSAVLRINKKYGHAVGGLDGEELAGAIGGGSVAFARVGSCLRENPDQVRVDLPQGNEVEIACPERSLKTAAIFDDVFGGVPFHKAEVEDFFGFQGADAAGAGAEAVDEPGELEKGSELENLQAAGFAQAPWRGDAGDRRRRGHRLARATALQRSFSGSHNQTSIIASGPV